MAPRPLRTPGRRAGGRSRCGCGRGRCRSSRRTVARLVAEVPPGAPGPHGDVPPAVGHAELPEVHVAAYDAVDQEHDVGRAVVAVADDEVLVEGSAVLEPLEGGGGCQVGVLAVEATWVDVVGGDAPEAHVLEGTRERRRRRDTMRHRGRIVKGAQPVSQGARRARAGRVATGGRCRRRPDECVGHEHGRGPPAPRASPPGGRGGAPRPSACGRPRHAAKGIGEPALVSTLAKRTAPPGPVSRHGR